MKRRVKNNSLITLFLSVTLFYFTVISEADPGKIIILKMANNGPDGLAITNYLTKDVSMALEAATDGEVSLSWYNGGIMGTDEDWIAKMHIDQLQGAAFDGSGVDKAVPEMGIIQLPFIFNNSDEVAYVKERLRERIDKLFQKKGYKLLNLPQQAWDEIFSTKRAVRTPKDFSRVRFVTYGGSVQYELLKSLGASPIPVSLSEANSSIRSGICTGIVIPSVWYVGSQLYALGGYVTPSNLRYVLAAVVLTEEAWSRIPEKHYKPILDVMLDYEPGITSCMAGNNENCLQAMIKYGMKEVKLTPNEIEVLKGKTRPVWDSLAGKAYSRELLDEILYNLGGYRSKDIN
ncbi:MAG: TRAP transporter substrate-binding protein DctP [Thermodesulfobacteriota bacterium]|nr:TRAP transporter substrate-binding protein DctP [Thermodesulfobacteriota bacterium]